MEVDIITHVAKDMWNVKLCRNLQVAIWAIAIENLIALGNFLLPRPIGPV